MAAPFAFETTSYEGEGEIAAAPIQTAAEPAKAPAETADPKAEAVETFHKENDKSLGEMTDKFKELTKPEEAKEAKEEKKTAEDPENEQDMPKKKAGWQKLKADRDNALKTVAELNEKLAKASERKQTPELEEKMARLTQERDELSAQLQKSAIEYHPRFKSYFDSKFKVVVDAARAAVPADYASKVEKALKIGDQEVRNERLESIAEELTDLQKSRLGVAVARYDEVTLERDAELARAGESKNKLDEETKAQTLAREQETEKIFSQAATEAMKHVEFFKPVEGEDKWNEVVKKDLEMAKNVFMGKDMEPADLARASIWAVAGPKIYTSLIDVSKQLQKANAQLAKYRTATPGVAGKSDGKAAGPVDPNTPPDGGTDFINAFNKALRG